MGKGKKWTEGEVNILKGNWQRKSATVLSEMFGRSYGSVLMKAHRLGLKKRWKWHADTEKFLVENWLLLSTADMAAHFNISTVAVRQKALQLSLPIRRDPGEVIVCAWCNKRLYRNRSHIAEYKLHFCGNECKFEMMRSGKFTPRIELHSLPNKPELELSSLLQKTFPGEYKYNGDYSQGVVLGGLVPDFINVNGKKQVIELFGDYWHDKKGSVPWKATEFGRKAIFSQLGFSCLVIWEHELKSPDDVVERIREFNDK